MPAVLTSGRLTNSPKPDLCCTSISNQTSNLWCEQVACDPVYVDAGFCKWTPCGTSAPTVPPTTAPPVPPTTAPTRARLTDGTIYRAVSEWCYGGQNQTRVEITYGPIAEWDTSQVTSMSGLFWDKFTCNPPIGNWNTAAVTSMARMFRNAIKFNQPIGKWNTAAVTDMRDMFYNASAFDFYLGTWNTAKVIDMSNMFTYAAKFSTGVCWTHRSHTDIFAGTSCPFLPSSPSTRSCWGVGTPAHCCFEKPNPPGAPVTVCYATIIDADR